MANFGVKDVSKLSGVSVRTLHYYDEIGILKPSSRTEAGYRNYGQKELLQLQQILFYREMDFPLKEIGEMLEKPDFDLMDTLENHKKALRARKKRISQLLTTIDKTIEHLQKEKIMTKPEMLYRGLPKEMGTIYRKVAMDQYGQELVEQSEKDLLKLGKEGFETLNKVLQEITAKLFAMREESPETEKVQKLVAIHFETICQFWGTSVAKEKQVETYAGLGESYVHDKRYTMINGEYQPEFADFLRKAMAFYAQSQLK